MCFALSANANTGKDSLNVLIARFLWFRTSPEPKREPKPVPPLVEVWRAYGEIDAQLIRSVLECNGVECTLSGEALRLTHGITVNGLGEVRVLVRSADAKRAQEILAASENIEGPLSA